MNVGFDIPTAEAELIVSHSDVINSPFLTHHVLMTDTIKVK